MEKQYQRAKQVISRLEQLAEHYPFFRYMTPELVFQEDQLDLSTYIDVDLVAGDRDSPDYLSVGMNSNHAYVRGTFVGKDSFVTGEAQESMAAKGKGLEAIRQFFGEYGKVWNKDYMLIIGEDRLRFDEKSYEHSDVVGFRGWTGGYDPGISTPPGEDLLFRLEKFMWFAQEVFISIEGRVNTLKVLFDYLNGIAGLPVRDKADDEDGWVLKEVDYMAELDKVERSPFYKHMLEIKTELEKRFRRKLTRHIRIGDKDWPEFWFSDDLLLVQFEHLPHHKNLVEIHIPQRPYNRHLREKRQYYTHFDGPNKGKKMARAHEYFDLDKDPIEAADRVYADILGLS